MEVYLGGIPVVTYQRKGGCILSKVFVGIDVSKDFSTAQGLNKNERSFSIFGLQ
jgi:hypothetical protein